MTKKNGFTMAEMIVTMIIVGFLVALAWPAFITSMEQTKAQSAQTNLMAIAAGQSKYNEDYGSYCVQAGCGDTTANLINKLHLAILPSDPYTYRCVAASPYICTAIYGPQTLTLNPSCSPATSTCPTSL